MLITNVCVVVNHLENEGSSMKRPNPNNPMEYCSTIPPLLQVGPTQPNPPSVLVPVVGVLKREGIYEFVKTCTLSLNLKNNFRFSSFFTIVFDCCY